MLVGAGAGDGGNGVDFGHLVRLAVPFLGSPLAIFLGFASRWRWGAGSILRRWGGVPAIHTCMSGLWPRE